MAFNRTNVELKCQHLVNKRSNIIVTFNRTNVELKLADNFTAYHPQDLLIVPMWN